MYDINYIVNLLEEWGIQVEQHPTKSDEGGWYAWHHSCDFNGKSYKVQFNKNGVLMACDHSVIFDGGISSDSMSRISARWFAGIIYAECVV